MYTIGKEYKIRMKQDNIFYTATILEEDINAILINDKHNEEFIIAKSEIKSAKMVQDNTGEGSVKREI